MWLTAAAFCLALTLSSTELVAQQAGTVTGEVTNEATGRGIPAAQISLVGTSLGGLTAANGRYLLLNVPAGTYTVRAEIIGYQAQEQQVTVTAGAAANASFALRIEAISMNELVVTGTAGASRRREIGNSVATLNIQELSEVKAANNVSDLLQGQVTGLQQFTMEGSPGAGTRILIRGNNSLTQGNSPLIYVDGIRLVSGTPGDRGSQQMTSALNLLNPNDIDRVEVIRGAAATTLYGTEANSGVIQIFTKRGRPGPAVWSFGTQYGATKLTSNNLGPVIGPDPTWQGIKPWVNTGIQYKLDGSVRGSASGVTYYLSGEYGDEGGVFSDQENGNNSTLASFRTNLSFQPLASLNLAARASYSHRLTDWVQSGDNSYGVILNLLRSPKNYVSGDDALVFQQRTTSLDDHFVGGITATFNPIPSLTNRFTAGIDWRDNTNDWTIARDNVLEPDGQRTLNRWRRTTITVDYVGTWQKDFMENLASQFSFGGQLFNDYMHNEYGSAQVFSGPGLEQTLSSGALPGVSEQLEKSVNAGFFFQEMLGWKDRLFVTAGVRVDGNSAFGESYGLQPYPKLTASYVLSDLGVLPEAIDVLKLRGAIGEAGRAPGVFDAARTWSDTTGNEDKAGVTPSNLGNANLGPERTRELELGFEGSAFTDRVSFDFTWYNAVTRDALVNVQYPPSQGFPNAQLTNIGEIQNKGLEVTLGLTPIQSPGLTVSFTGQYSHNKSQANNLGGNQLQIGSASWRQWAIEGYPVPGYWDLKVSNPDAIADPVYEQFQYYGPSYPTDNVSISTNINFLERFTLYALGEGAYGHYHMAAVGRQGAIRDLWPSCSVADPSAQNALWRAQCEDYEWAAWIIPADFFKLRTVSLTYQIPDRIFPGVSQSNFTLAAQNLWKSTKYQGLDPELTRGDVALAVREYYHIPQGTTLTASLRVVF
ncbi:MAG TPA: TonB-dependent receptor [Longimicrobiales bacterium]|nr:TonB-dependent receptor [Longimicrobiales bacterium]